MNKKTSLGLWGILLLEYLFIFTFLLNYDLAWMNPEKFAVHRWILSNGPQWKAEDWGRSLNIDQIELNGDRLSRPLSNFVEVVDTKFRASLWNFTTPHPALSLQWPFMFILLPWLLYQTFINMGCFPFVALTGVGVYIASIGFLGPLVMLFHPAKNLVNFFGALSMFFFSLRASRGALFAGFLSLFLGFISDETGIYLYLAAILLFHPLWLQLWKDKRYGALSGLLLLPLVYFLFISLFMPYLHWLVRGAHIRLSGYESYPSLKSLFWPDWNLLWLNTQFLFADHPHLLINYIQLSAYPLIMAIQMIYVLVFLLLILLFLLSFPSLQILSFPRKRESSKADPQQKNLLILLAAGILLMLGYCFFQTFQLSQNAKAWGIWWYGSLFSFIYVFPLVFYLQIVYSNHKWLGRWAVLIALVFVLNGLIFSTYRIAALKHQNLNRTAYSYIDIFKGKVDPYQLFAFHRALERSYCKKMYAHLYWRRWKGLPEDVDPAEKDKCYSDILAADYYFMIIENGYLPTELH